MKKFLAFLSSSSAAPSFALRLALPTLNPEQCRLAFTLLRQELLTIINTPIALNIVLSQLSREQRIVVYDALKDIIPGLIKTGQDFARVIENLPPEQRIAVYFSSKNKISSLISVNEFEWISSYYTTAQGTMF